MLEELQNQLLEDDGTDTRTMIYCEWGESEEKSLTDTKRRERSSQLRRTCMGKDDS